MATRRSMMRWCVSHRFLFTVSARRRPGQFGNIDGDSAAAYRYTGSAHDHRGAAPSEGIEDDAMTSSRTISGRGRPVVLPSALPNLLANGAQGIAVGMATPFHRIMSRACDAALYLIAHRNATASNCSLSCRAGFSHGGIVIDSVKTFSRLTARARLVPATRALEQGRAAARRLGHHRNRDTLWGTEIAPDRAPRRTCDGEKLPSSPMFGRVRRRHPDSP